MRTAERGSSRGCSGPAQKPWVGMLLLMSLVTGAEAVRADGDAATITVADFELGDVSTWSAQLGGTDPPFPDSFRFSEFALRDPHILVDLPVFNCTDITDNGIPLIELQSVNDQIAEAIATDGDADGCLDLSTMLLFRPLDQMNDGGRMDLRPGRCAPPANDTSCSVDGSTGGTAMITVDNIVGGNPCLGVLSGTSSNYTPQIVEPVGDCFVGQPVDLEIELVGGLTVPLVDVQLAAAYDASPAQTLGQGLLRGFLSEVAAAAVVLPADIPVVGGLPLTAVLPGGAGNCSTNDDRDMNEGQSGWWFYFEFSAERVPWTGL